MGDMSREPSMEDILSSIRRVIARDEAQMQTRLARATPVSDVMELDRQGHPAAEVPAEPAPTAREFAPVATASESDDSLVSHSSVDAARQSLDALGAAFAAAPQTASSPSSLSIEDLVMAALRPMLKDWLDTNLPPLVEAMVAKEIARISGRG